MSIKSKRRGSARSRRTTRPQPQIVKARGPADLLRFVPDLVAVDTEDSLVLVLFQRSEGTRSRTRGAMRVDLLHDDDPAALERWAAGVLQQALQVDGVTGIAVAAYTPQTFAPSGRPPAAPQVRAVGRQAERMGLQVLDRFCVGADGWGSLDDPALPRGGRPLAEIEPPQRHRVKPRSAAPVTVAAAGACAAFLADYGRWWTFADGVGGVLHGVRLSEPGSAFGVAAEAAPAMERYRWGEDTQEVVALIEGMLEPHEATADGAPCPCRALLLALAERQGIETLVLLQIAWGRGLAMEMWTAVTAPDGRGASLDRMVSAIGGGRFRRPDTDRIEHAIAVLQEVATLVPEEARRVAIDGMLAWLHWACGASSAAASYALRALRHHPGRDVPTMVLGKVERNELPLWAFRANPGRPDRFERLVEGGPAVVG
ncbi:hypothetical protein [uncultured Amnibacterium sp.]|uniref:hypothetical protein n=1 Tax=uncultured Amnibacterium sp. TaxID=1631851 RepID=UPI0035C9C35F